VKPVEVFDSSGKFDCPKANNSAFDDRKPGCFATFDFGLRYRKRVMTW
jgi:hypothetical protein